MTRGDYHSCSREQPFLRDWEFRTRIGRPLFNRGLQLRQRYVGVNITRSLSIPSACLLPLHCLLSSHLVIKRGSAAGVSTTENFRLSSVRVGPEKGAYRLFIRRLLLLTTLEENRTNHKGVCEKVLPQSSIDLRSGGATSLSCTETDLCHSAWDVLNSACRAVRLCQLSEPRTLRNMGG